MWFAAALSKRKNMLRTTTFRLGLALLVASAATPVFAQSGSGFLKTKINPGRAGVFIDGKYVGPAGNLAMGRKYAVAAGDHEVKLVEPRYEEITTKVSIASGKTFVLRETMKPVPLAEPPFGVLRIIYPEKFAAVYVNDRYYGHADEFNAPAQGLKLKPGSYNVKVAPLGGGAPLEEKVTIEADKTFTMRSK